MSIGAKITIETLIQNPIDKVWEFWTLPEHVMKWNQASEDWHTTKGENDLRTGGKFSYRMEAKDGSFGFDFGGVYDEVIVPELIRYTMADGRQVKVDFRAIGDTTKITEQFDAETTNDIEHQRMGWQSILDNFKKYVEKQ